MSLTVEKLLNLKHSKNRGSAPRFTYLGAGAKNKCMDLWLKVLGDIDSYVDVTAGSNNQPYMIGKSKNVPIRVNDASYYSYCIGLGLFTRQTETDIQEFAQLLVDAIESPEDGVFSQYEKMNTTVANYIDGVIALINERFSSGDAGFLKACVGHAIMGRYSMRALTFFYKRDVGVVLPDGTPPTILDFAVTAYRAARRKNSCFYPNGDAFYTHAKTFIETVNLEGATVNFDPAWPFAKKGMVNPYKFYIQVGSILRRQPLPTFPFWVSEKSEAVADEFTTWVALCLQKGAREVYAWNQTTNFPTYDDLVNRLEKDFQVSNALSVQQESTGHKYDFTDYVLKIEGK